MWWIRSDVCGMISAAFTVLLVLYAQYVIVTVVMLPWYGFTVHVPLYTTLSMLALFSHCRAQFTDPGAVPRDRLPPPPVAPAEVALTADGKAVQQALPPRVCRRCKTLKPWKAHHCSNCQRCIVRMDHHCPWVNNCVAIHNQKYFLLFLLYITLCCIYCGVLLVLRFLSCTNNIKTCTLSGVHAILCVLLFIEAVIFGLFCTIMLWDQLSAIFENTPGIDALQDRKGVSRGKYESLQEVFGEPLCWRWWLPLNMPPRVAQDFESELNQMDDPLSEEMMAAHFERIAAAADQRQGERALAHTQEMYQQQLQQQMVDQHDARAGGEGKQRKNSHAAGSSNGHPRSTAAPLSELHARLSTDPNAARAPVVFPDGFAETAAAVVHRDVRDPLAALQSPPRSPVAATKQGLQHRGAAATSYAH